MELEIPKEYTLLVPDRNVQLVENRDYTNGQWEIRIPAYHGHIIGIVFETEPITHLENVWLKDINSQPLDYWPLVPGSKYKIFLPVRMLPFFAESYYDYHLRFVNPSPVSVDIKISVVRIPPDEIRRFPAQQF